MSTLNYSKKEKLETPKIIWSVISSIPFSIKRFVFFYVLTWFVVRIFLPLVSVRLFSCYLVSRDIISTVFKRFSLPRLSPVLLICLWILYKMMAMSTKHKLSLFLYVDESSWTYVFRSLIAFLQLVSDSGYNFKAVRRWTTQRKLGYPLIDCDMASLSRNLNF